jgi:hypothetical protein
MCCKKRTNLCQCPDVQCSVHFTFQKCYPFSSGTNDGAQGYRIFSHASCASSLIIWRSGSPILAPTEHLSCLDERNISPPRLCNPSGQTFSSGSLDSFPPVHRLCQSFFKHPIAFKSWCIIPRNSRPADPSSPVASKGEHVNTDPWSSQNDYAPTTPVPT